MEHFRMISTSSCLICFKIFLNTDFWTPLSSKDLNENDSLLFTVRYGGMSKCNSNLCYSSPWYFTFLTFVYVIISLALVLKNFCGRMRELYMSGKASLACWRAKCLKSQTASLKAFYSLIHTLYLLFFLD